MLSLLMWAQAIWTHSYVCNFKATFHPRDLIRLIVEMAKHYTPVPTVPPLAMTTQKLIVNRFSILRVKWHFCWFSLITHAQVCCCLIKYREKRGKERGICIMVLKLVWVEVKSPPRWVWPSTIEKRHRLVFFFPLFSFYEIMLEAFGVLLR